MRPLLLLAGCLAITLSVVTYGVFSDDGVGKTRRLSAEKAELERRVQRLEQENAQLADEIEQLRDTGNKRALEKTVREELGYVRSDEVVVLTD